MGESLIQAQGSGEQAQSDQVQGDQAQGEAPARPEWLPEKFFVEGKPAYDLMAKSYTELETKFRSKEDDLRNKLIEELANEAVSNRPEAPEKYEMPELEGVNFEEIAQHPLTQWWAKFAFENGFDQDTFKTGIQTYIESQSFGRPDPEQEIKALGDNARARTEAVGLWVGQNFGQDEISQIERLCTTAAGVKVMERIMSMVRGDSAPVVDDGPGVPQESDIYKMMQDRRYWSPSDRDPNFVKMVESFFQKKYK